MEATVMEAVELEAGAARGGDDTESVPGASTLTTTCEDPSPPEYAIVGIPAQDEADASPDHEGDVPPLDYDTVMSLPADSAVPVSSDETEQLKGSSIMAEAPPSYREIFGEQRMDTVPQTRRWKRTQRPHTLSRRQQSAASNTNTISRLFSCLPRMGSRILVIIIALFVFILPLSMVTVGSFNINICSSKDIPLYLIIAGTCLSVEVVIHTVTILASMNTENESALRSLRMCDCFAFFILIWILIGSNWIFKVSVNRSSSCSILDVEIGPIAENSTHSTSDIASPASCGDCSNSVYQFAVGLIVLQYMVVFLVFVFCCCVAMKRGTN